MRIKLIRLLSVITIVLLSSCENQDDNTEKVPDCSTVLCEALSTKIQLIDNNTDLNLIDENNWNVENFKITTSENINPPLNGIANDENLGSLIAMSFVTNSTLIINDSKKINLKMEKS